MNILFNILFIISAIGMLVGCSAGDAAHGCCGLPGTQNDEERYYFDKICKYIGVPSIILFMFILFSHWRFDVTLLGLF